MPNHYHLLVETPRPNLSIGMPLVERESHLLELCQYVVLNPLRIKRMSRAVDLKWTSYAATAGLAPVPEFLTVEWGSGAVRP